MATYQDTLRLVDKVSGPLEKMSKKLGDFEKRAEKARKRVEHLAKAGDKLKGFGNKLTLGLTLPIVAAGAASIKFASDMEETLNKVDVSFGKSSEAVKQWAKSSITTMGLAQQSALDSAALFGDMATGMGLSQEKASEMAMNLTQLGADLASFKNISNEVAKTSLKAIFTGETESLKNLGVVMTQTNLEQFAYSKGIRKKMKDMTEAEKIQLRYNYVMEQTKNAQGDFVRTGGGAANQMRMFQEQMKELGVLFGQVILPAFTKLIAKLNNMLKVFNKMTPGQRKFIVVMAGIIALIGPLVAGIGTVITALTGLSVVAATFGISMGAAIGIVAGIPLAIAAVVAALVLLWKNWDKIWNGIKNITMKVINGIVGFINKLLDKLGWLAYLIPGLAQIKIGKDIASAVGNKINNNRVSQTQNNNSTSNVYNTTNNYGGGGGLGGLTPLTSGVYAVP